MHPVWPDSPALAKYTKIHASTESGRTETKATEDMVVSGDPRFQGAKPFGSQSEGLGGERKYSEKVAGAGFEPTTSGL